MSSRKNVLRPFKEKKDFMNGRIRDGIEANRKGYAFLKLVDESGNPVKDADVKITQKSHDFKYGANLFMLDEFSKEKRSEAKKNGKYREIFAEMFNIATLPFYWDTLEPEQGKPRFAKGSKRIYRRPVPDLCLEYCEEAGIEPKAHCLNYCHFMPKWALGSVQWEKMCLEKRFRELSERYGKRIPMWEVTNETNWTWCNASLYTQDDLVEWSFALAEKYFPANKLVINEAHIRAWKDFVWNRSPYYMQIQRALLKGARIDGIGMQFHMFYRREMEETETAVFYDPERIYNVMDTYAKLGKPMHVTELTIPAYSNDPEDEEIQAEILKNLYGMWFSHPAMDGIIYWNLPDGYAHGTTPGDMSKGENYYYGGLLRFDFSLKPAGQVIRDLFGKEWRTVLTKHSSSSGELSFKGFYGTYDLEISAGGRKTRETIRLSKESNRHFTIKL
ncbi:MAG: endo-1,4-beta-xylanase [Lentisphaeria bacterium]|nr:endo-1,4-beta-xylanase [Lentisphaeria bacterium]